MTKKQIKRLFPIILEPHNPAWKADYLRERDLLQTVFGDSIVRISHIGSTAVAGLIAKPTVDILLEVAETADIPAITKRMRDAGYLVNTPKSDIIMYIKGYTPCGFELPTVHAHVRHSADWGELYFRDYLMCHPDAARAYEALKLELKEKFTHDRDGYTGAKGAFVQKYTELARLEFPGKYAPAGEAR
ncbi:MAG: GrpB family protein [Oscillospiraceae bacterium]|nr:GrpB family protein [Oscillospiraceae bacterium]